jgi:HEPN domain-containing protein
MVRSEVKEWFSKAEKDFDEARFLFNNDRPSEHVAFFLHQSVEKCLKGFLISKGWELEKTHDLVKLIKEAISFDKSLEKFIPLMEDVASYYIESRYPIGSLIEYDRNEIEKSLESTQAFIDILKTGIG